MNEKESKNHIVSVEKRLLRSGEALSMLVSHIKQNYQISFRVRIDTFGKITIGNGKDQIFSTSYIVIDEQKISAYFLTREEELTGEFLHGLKIQKYLNVSIRVLDNLTADVLIGTESGMFSCNVSWKGCAGVIYAENVAGGFTDGSLKFYCQDYNKEIWGFGDSYFGRWPQVLNEWGYRNWMVDGYSGRNAESALVSFKRCLEFGTPQKVIWALGMNDPDTEESIHSGWMEVQKEVEGICSRKGIELILLSIPAVPDRIHKYKNEYIRRSGYRYVDIEKAVGADLDVNWYDGLLDEDKVHPTDLGRKQIAMKVAMEIMEMKSL